MIMKKTVAILLVAVMALSFVACASKKIVGKWEVTDITGDGSEYSGLLKGATYEFNSDGTYKIAHPLGVSNGTYKVKGSKLFLDDDNKEYIKLSFSGDTMKWTGTDGSITFKKK